MAQANRIVLPLTLAICGFSIGFTCATLVFAVAPIAAGG
jgi:hypothetical protein